VQAEQRRSSKPYRSPPERPDCLQRPRTAAREVQSQVLEQEASLGGQHSLAGSSILAAVAEEGSLAVVVCRESAVGALEADAARKYGAGKGLRV
jgi:hypothetical protein